MREVEKASLSLITVEASVKQYGQGDIRYVMRVTT